MHEPIAVVLAAGKGTRMNSDLPKVLFPVHGRAMVHYVLDALSRAGVRRSIVVIGYGADQVRAELASRGDQIEFVLQAEQLGTGHAVQMCRERIAGHEGPVIVVAGDSPLLQSSSLEKLLEHYREHRPAALLGTLIKADPKGLGRIVRDRDGTFQGIVEEKDASEAQRAINEVNMSTYVFHAPDLLESLDALSNNNAQGEYYITDVPAILRSRGREVAALPVLADCESLSINNLDELRQVESRMHALGYPLNA